MSGFDADARLRDADLQRLEQFLGRGGASTMSIESVDGLFAALVCSPILVRPSEWMPVIWGDTPPEWECIDEAREFHDLIMRLWNQNARTINDGTYSPLYTLFEDEAGKDVVLPHVWCRGFYRGMEFHLDLWLDETNLELGDLLMPIRKIMLDIVAAIDKDGEYGAERLSPEEQLEYADMIPESVIALREYWLEHPVAGADRAGGAGRPSRAAPKVGRNEPCPCGSGKKFKRCHGQGEPIM